VLRKSPACPAGLFIGVFTEIDGGGAETWHRILNAIERLQAKVH
jgi:hypothetical protein